MSKILGISPDAWISSAAILVDGKVIAACAEERFNRQKGCKGDSLNLFFLSSHQFLYQETIHYFLL